MLDENVTIWTESSHRYRAEEIPGWRRPRDSAAMGSGSTASGPAGSYIAFGIDGPPILSDVPSYTAAFRASLDCHGLRSSAALPLSRSTGTEMWSCIASQWPLVLR